MSSITSSATSAAAYVTIAGGTPFRGPSAAGYLDHFDPGERPGSDSGTLAGAVCALARALHAKDADTARHSVRVGRLAEAIAGVLGLGTGFRRGLRLAGELHDVGKIGVPDDLLQRPARLSAQEHREILQHTVIGERILAPLLPNHPMVLATVRSHHEWFDGRGFPDGLRGRAIPLAARIVAVADAFDAMTSARPYRLSLGRAAALRELRRGAGSQFDPACVRALLRVLDSSRRARLRPVPWRRDMTRSLGLVSHRATGGGGRNGSRQIALGGRRRVPPADLRLVDGRRARRLTGPPRPLAQPP